MDVVWIGVEDFLATEIGVEKDEGGAAVVERCELWRKTVGDRNMW